MKTIEELQKQYAPIPNELKQLKRWVGYSIVEDNNTGEVRKMPINPLNGTYAKSNDPLTWTSFNVAINGYNKYNLVGIGFVLGEVSPTLTYFGVDLDNHPDKVTGEKLPQEEFDALINEFISTIDTYAEFSHSGEGVHLICKGKLPEGARRKKGCSVEMYDSGRFFTMTGNTINQVDIKECSETIKPLYDKYLASDDDFIPPTINSSSNHLSTLQDGKKRIITEVEEVSYAPITLSDEELIKKIMNSKQGNAFSSLYYDGDMSRYGNDHSIADEGLCTMLAFWCGNDAARMDRLFRNSALMRDKWDEKRGKDTYGNLTIGTAISINHSIYEPKQVLTPISASVSETVDDALPQPIENIDSNGNVIVKINPSFIKQYEVSDTGNAQRMYDYFGDLFRYNKDTKCFMFWNGKMWLQDTRDGDMYVRKYADETKEFILDEIKHDRDAIDSAAKEMHDEDRKLAFYKSEYKKIAPKEANAVKISNKAGKDAMISELKHIKNMIVGQSDFNQDIYLLNTKSGVVNLENGEIMPFDKKLMQSKSTNCEVSFEEPKIWIKFLHDIFERGNEKETQELVDTIQKAVGYSLTGSTKEQCAFFLYGATGSNGKSTFIETIQKIMGDYASTTPAATIMARHSGNKNTETLYALSKLHNARLVSCGETEDGERISESTLKILTGSDTIQARHPYGEEFDFKPTFHIFMATNHKPIIRGREQAIWRRIYLFPFVKTFEGDKKDKNLPEKLEKELPQILGWAIQGTLKYLKEGLEQPECIERELAEYKDEMNVIAVYLKEQTTEFTDYLVKSSVLFKDYYDWARRNNEKTMSQTKFASELQKMGYKRKAKSDGNYYIGLKLNDVGKGRIIQEEDE